MKRYNSVYDGVYTKPNEMVEEANGDWVRWEDVAKLEAQNAELLEALKYAPVPSKYHGIRGFETNRFLSDYEAWMKNRRAAIAKAKGETL